MTDYERKPVCRRARTGAVTGRQGTTEPQPYRFDRAVKRLLRDTVEQFVTDGFPELERRLTEYEGKPIWTAQMLEVLRDYFGGHEEMQDAIYEWRRCRIGADGTWLNKGAAIHALYAIAVREE